MKKTYLIIIAILAMVACEKEKSKDYLIFSGTIKNLEIENIDLLNVGNSFKKTIKVNADGMFSDTLKIESGYYSLAIDKKNIELYLNKIEDLQIVYNLRDTLSPINFVGKFENENNYLLKKFQFLKNNYGDNNELYTLEEKEFLKKINLKESHLKELANTSYLDGSFLNQELRNLHYKTIIYLDNYESFHRYFAKNKDFVVSDSFPLNNTPSDLNNIDDFNNSLDYRKIIQTYYHKKVTEQPNVNDDVYNIVYMDLVNEGATNPIIKNQLLFDNTKYGITFTTETETFYKKFMASSTNEKHKAEITKTYNILQKTAKGKNSPKFINYENYNGEKTSLDDLKGKYVYVDVWATWCGPCKKEIPFLKELEKQYHDKNIAFVSISIDKAKDIDKWKKMVKDKEMTGVQLFADNDWKSDFVKDYNIVGIPRFILIDPNSKIVSASALRPSNPDTRAYLDELLK